MELWGVSHWILRELDFINDLNDCIHGTGDKEFFTKNRGDLILPNLKRIWLKLI